MNRRDRHPEEQRYWRDRASWEDEYGFGRRTPWREPYRQQPFGPPDEPHYYGTGAAGWGGPGFTGGAYGWGDGSRSPHLPLEGDYSDESTLSYEDQVRRDYRAGGSGGSRARGRLYPPGPKGYQRSDERMKEDISERLFAAYHIDSSEVTVDVRGGRVALEGTVPSRHMKHAIEDMVDSCPGVMEIDNRILVAGPNSPGTSPTSASSPTVKSSTKQ